MISLMGKGQATGRLIAVVAPSGAGKDTLLSAAQRARPDLVFSRRVITRPETADGEQHEGVDQAEFDERQRAGKFAIWWRAHGLSYGVPSTINDQLAEGQVVIFNGSRSALSDTRADYPDLATVLITAPTEMLRGRLVRRGRERPDQIEARLAAADMPAPKDAIIVTNDGTVTDGVARLLAAIDEICSSAG